MGRFVLRKILAYGAVLALGSAAWASGTSGSGELSPLEMAALKSCEGIVRLFESSTDRIWPGYDLSRRPFLVYIPGSWALLVNPPEGAREFGPLPAGWPPLGIKAGFFDRQYRDLVGQLAFDFDVDGTKVVAIGLIEGQFPGPDSGLPALFGFIVHEAFHQYQSEAFGEIPWEREERYPILDAGNSALAALEMKVLNDAVGASLAGRRPEAEGLIREFIAVRSQRWEKAPAFVARYEQGQEVREGTAAYVEKMSLALARELEFKSALEGPTRSLPRVLEPLTPAELFRRDFEGRTTEGAVSPQDMIRNRIYPVGSALGFLTDLWGSDWKKELAGHTETFTFHGWLRDKLGLKAEDLPTLLRKAENDYDYPAILRSASQLIAGYRSGFEKDLAAFEGQPGTRVEVRLRYRSISRSRSSQGRSWVVDDGGQTLMTRARVYSLKTGGFLLKVKESPLLEGNDWDARDKRIALFTPEPPIVVLDGARRALGASPDSLPFSRIELTASNLELKAELPGILRVENGRLSIEFEGADLPN
jgi:hypothetical protein